MSNLVINRKQFLRFAGIGTCASFATAAATGALAGSAMAEESAGAKSADTEGAVGEVVETMETDVVVVGAGMSGLAAAVQAGVNGDRVILLEAFASVGGSAFELSGICGWNSSLQKAQGIEWDIDEVIRHEMADSQYGVDPLFWKLELEASGEQIDWLIEQGVQFEEEVDDYHGTSMVQNMHWFRDLGINGYTAPMVAKAQECGVDIRVSSEAVDLVMENGVVRGVTATIDGIDGLVKIDAPVVILATGGFSANIDMMKRYGFNPDFYEPYITYKHMGDGKRMAMSVGAGEFMHPCWEGILQLEGTYAINADGPIAWLMAMQGPCLWVNREGKRFVNEDLGFPNFDLPILPTLAQRGSYVVFTRDIATSLLEEIGATIDALDEYIERNPDSIVIADEPAGLEGAFGIDAETLRATFDAYQQACHEGVDTVFAKDPSFLVPMDQGPHYIAKVVSAIDVTVGSVNIDQDARVLDTDYQPIPGLYAVGLDGCMLYRNVYTIGVSGTACMNSIFTGRAAANHAHSYLA